MPGPVDPRGLADNQRRFQPLVEGLDLGGGPINSRPGSLRMAVNVEFVDGVLQQTGGIKGVGYSSSDIFDPNPWVMWGTSGVDWIVAGTDPPVSGDRVFWYKADAGDTAKDLVVGTAIVRISQSWLEGFVALYDIQGRPPEPGEVIYFYSEYPYKGTGSIQCVNKYPAPLMQNIREIPAHLIDDIMEGPIGAWSDVWDSKQNPVIGPHIGIPGGNTSGRATTHLFTVDDKLFAACDFPILEFYQGKEEPAVGDVLEVQNGANTASAVVRHVELGSRSSEWAKNEAEGWIYLEPSSSTTLTSTQLTSFVTAGEAYVHNLTTATNNVMRVHSPENTSAVSFSKREVSHSILWAIDGYDRSAGWRKVDMGHSCRFYGGLTAPITREGPIFVSDQIESVTNTGWTEGTVTEESSLSTAGSAWTNVTNAQSEDSTYATNTLAADSKTRNLRFKFADDLIPGKAKILGVEIRVRAKADANGEAYFEKSRMQNEVNDSPYRSGPPRRFDAGQVLSYKNTYNMREDYFGDFYSLKSTSEDRAPDQDTTITNTDAYYIFGGPDDLWGFPNIAFEDFFTTANPDGIGGGAFENRWLFFDLAFGSLAGVTPTVSVDSIEAKIYYILEEQQVYFWNGTQSVGTGDLYAYQVHDGDWSTDDAKGWITIHNYAQTAGSTVDVYPQADCEIRTADSGGGDLIGYVDWFRPNLLPGYNEMATRGTRCTYVESSVGKDSSRRKAFVCNGVSPAFAVDRNGLFQFIRLPVDGYRDHPKYVADHRNHLVLALDEHIMVSSVGSPNVFSTFDGATAWAVNDTVTGLATAPDNSLIVMGTTSISRLHGSAASGQDSFQLVRYSGNGGAMHYSTTGVAGDVYFMTPFGISSLSASDKYGDFSLASLSDDVYPWLKDRIRVPNKFREKRYKGLLKAVPIRSKSQIRYYFEDGWILIMHLGERPTFTTQHYGVEYPYTYTYSPESLSGGRINAEPDRALCDVVSSKRSDGTEALYGAFIDGTISALDFGHFNVTSIVVTNPLLNSNPLEEAVKVQGFTLGLERGFNLKGWLWTCKDFELRLPTLAEAITTGSGCTYAWQNDLAQTETWDGFPVIDTGTHHEGLSGQGIGFAWCTTQVDNTPDPIRFLGLSYEISPLSAGRARLLRPAKNASTHDKA